jgi:hypothetical protein
MLISACRAFIRNSVIFRIAVLEGDNAFLFLAD